MAVMFPKDIGRIRDATPGEIKVFQFLQEVAKPDKNYLCWYEPTIGGIGTKPDFILYGENLGLLVLEVKDWAIGQIESADSQFFMLQKGGKTEEVTNPDKQAKRYVDGLISLLKKYPEFLSADPFHRGNLKIPVGRMVAFPNISYHDYYQIRLHQLIPESRALFQEDLDPLGSILCDVSGRKFVERLEDAFLFPFEGLTVRSKGRLADIIWPEILLPQRQGIGKSEFQHEIISLDDYQWKEANKLRKGHQIIKGPPGSGKTLILIYRCGQIYKFSLSKKRILLTCFNIALASYLKRLIQEKGLGIGEGGIQVCHFFEVCSHILGDSLGELVQYDKKDSDYYNLIIEYSIDVAKRDNNFGKFDVIIIDEGQDFSNGMLKILLSLLRPGGDFIIALDPYQDLYRRRVSWSSLGINARGRSRYIKKVYRNTIEIHEFTQKFIGETLRKDITPSLFSEESGIHGEVPQIRGFKTIAEIEAFLISDLNRHIKQEQYKRSEIAVIYDDKKYGTDTFHYDNRELPQRLYNLLEKSGIPTKWVSQDIRTKELFDITTDRVSLVSIHSSKGLDFELVYLIGIDRMIAEKELEDHFTRLLYVAMTRAKYKLIIVYIEETEFIKRMKCYF
jgi:hypothetical protein